MSYESDLVLSWQNLSLCVTVPVQNGTTSMLMPWKRTKKESLKLLNNVSGFAKSGTLLAIMGPSGSGKTSLLAAISKRTLNGIQGEILLNGRPVDKNLMLRVSGFVPQKDLAVETLTVKEHIEFMAALKMDRRISSDQISRITHALINDLGLNDCKNTLLQDVSGGERRRLSLAVQLLTDPPILFCDEPTTGLDSYSASTVVNVLRQLASRGKVVICSIHQPSSDVFMLFNQLCLLLPGGHLAFHGDFPNCKAHFESLGFQFPTSYNPADFLLHILNPSNTVILHSLVDEFDHSIAKGALVKELDMITSLADENNVDLFFGIEERFLKFYSLKCASLTTQLQLLIWRAAISMYRNSQRVMLRFLLYIFTGLLVSSPYIGLRLDQEGIQNFQGFHYAVITETIFCHAYSVMHTFPSEIPILLREMGNGVYKPGPYYFSKVLIILPRAVLETLIFCSVVFWVAEVKGGAFGFLIFSLPVIACAITSTAYGCFISALFENITTASLLSVPIDFVSYTFSGLFLQLSTVPLYLSWLKYFSRFYYGMEAISILQWQEVEDISCSENKNIPCIRTGQGVLEKYGFSPNNLNLDFFAMFVGFFILHFLGFLTLKRRSRQQSVY
ncbi:protein scarlet-like [Lycorma delicatula]|uniref:protein scarlet-like n=1 Tax=Lycorma delicatula TaxID=130591 RepID=UPI003F50EB89